MLLFKENSVSSGNIEKVKITKENLADFVKSNSIINELPKSADIELRFYNINNGERIWEERYIIKKSLVEKGNVENPDLVVILDSKYIEELGDFCYALTKAHNNGDLRIEFKKSKVSLLWKYGGILKYKSCLGY